MINLIKENMKSEINLIEDNTKVVINLTEENLKMAINLIEVDLIINLEVEGNQKEVTTSLVVVANSMEDLVIKLEGVNPGISLRRVNSMEVGLINL